MKKALLATAIVSSIGIGSLVFAGPLTPPAGPVAQTMKTLDQVEPRIPLSQDDVPITLSISGSYYLTESLFSSGAPLFLIRITASDVTLDLQGFSLVGTTGIGLTQDGILIEDFAQNAEIHNGTIRDCLARGVSAPGASNVRLIDLRLRNNGTDGASFGTGGAAINCNAMNNDGSGLRAGPGSVIIECTATSNGGSGIVATGGGLFPTGATTISDCASSANGSDGITAHGCTITNNTTYGNGRDGIRIDGNCLVRANNCNGNGTSVVGAGIRVINSGDNRIEDNNCTLNDIGIEVNSASNVIIRNVCSGNTTNNWNVTLGNVCLVINASTTGSFTGNSGGVSPGTTNPWANFTY
jgi:parallel beta-helix repeat protein